MSHALRAALTKHLQADTELAALVGGRIFAADFAPEGATFPLILVATEQAPRPSRVYGGIGYVEATYAVKAIDTGTSAKNAAAIAAAINDRLEDAEFEVEGYVLLACQWAEGIERSTSERGKTFQIQGGYYDVMAEQT